jgi:hypothetical protein
MLKLNPFQTAIAVLPYTLTMVVVLLTLLVYLSIDQKVAPKYVIFCGLALLGVGLLQIYSVMDLSLTTLKLLPGLVIMGIGSAFFLAYISSLTYSVANQDEKPEGTGIYNPIQNLGSSLGRGILGTTLIFFTSQGIVNRVLEIVGTQFSPMQRKQAIDTLERLIQTYSAEEVGAVLAKLPAIVQPSLKTIIQTSALEGIRVSLLIAVFLVAVCFLLTTRLPSHPRR